MERGLDDVNPERRESPFQYLCLISNAAWSRFAMQQRVGGQTLYKNEVYIDVDSIVEFRKTQPWQMMVEYRLTLTVEEAIRVGKYKIFPQQYDILLALRHFPFYEDIYSGRDSESYRRHISMLISQGARPRTEDVIQCISDGDISVMDLLLQSWPKGKLELDRSTMFVPGELDSIAMQNYTYNGEIVGPLWELGRYCRYYKSSGFCQMLDFFLGRGEDINEICGPGGAIMHVLIINTICSTVEALLEPLKIVVERGANIDIAGPYGTPLQMTWKAIRHCDVSHMAMKAQEALKFFRDYGANCDWVEDDGRIVNKADIDALCGMIEVQIVGQCQPRWKLTTWYSREKLTHEEQLEAESSIRRKSFEFEQRNSHRMEVELGGAVSLKKYGKASFEANPAAFQFHHCSLLVSESVSLSLQFYRIVWVALAY